MFNFGQSQPPTLGIDISTSCIKVLQLSPCEQGYCIDHIGSCPLPEGCVLERVITDIETVANCIRLAVQQSQSKAKHCIMAVPSSNVMSKVITMPADLSDEELEAQINVEADQHIPFPLNEVNIDYNVLKNNHNNDHQVDVLLVCSKTPNITSKVMVAELAGLSPIIVDVESYLTERSFPYLNASLSQDQNSASNNDNHTVAIFDIGSHITTLNVIDKQQLIYTREHDFGGKQLSEKIMQAYQYDFQTAEQKKLSNDLPEDYQVNTLEPFIQTVAQQCSRFLQFFYSVKPSTPIQHIILCGGGSNIAGLDEILQQNVDIPTSTINPLAHLSYSSKVDPTLVARESSSFLVALGLALRKYSH